jgi:hypothetical protein
MRIESLKRHGKVNHPQDRYLDDLPPHGTATGGDVVETLAYPVGSAQHAEVAARAWWARLD